MDNLKADMSNNHDVFRNTEKFSERVANMKIDEAELPFPEVKTYRYYSTQRPISSIGTYPVTDGHELIVNYDRRTYVEAIGREAWGEIRCNRPLSVKEMTDYELVADQNGEIVPTNFLKLVEKVRTSSDFADEIYLNLKSHAEGDMRTDIKIFSDFSDGQRFKLKFIDSNDLIVDLPGMLKELRKYDLKSIYTYQELQDRNALYSDIRFGLDSPEQKEVKKAQLSEHEAKAEKRASDFNRVLPSLKLDEGLKEKVIRIYSDEFPAIKHVSYKTAENINNLMLKCGKEFSIAEIETLYKEVGRVDYSSSEFAKLSEVVTDLRQASLKELKDTAKVNALSQHKNVCRELE